MRCGKIAATCCCVILAASCAGEKQATEQAESKPVAEASNAAAAPVKPIDPVERDPFTYANYESARVTDLALDIDVLFDERVISGTATLTFERINPDADRLILDSNDLDISAVETDAGGEWKAAPFSLGHDDPNLGSKLDIEIPGEATKVRIAYRTSPKAEGLQWLTAAQTAGGAHPFMYSQNQAINARSMAPVQDTPAVRMTYSARVRTPPDLLAVMGAEQDRGPHDGDYAFKMPQPVPAYLLALAVGDLAFRPVSETIGVYAEPSVIDAAAKEFEDTPQMEAAASALYGPYLWGRYDLLVLPPSFPFGGMENPRLSFVTPTLIAGDKSLVGTVAHELAHSWSGNLVTNATWSDAWLNEGVTSYVENRLMEDVFGRDRAIMEQALAFGDLKAEIADLEDPKLSRLQLPPGLDHPDDAFSDVSYVKGQFFLHFLEARYGRAAFDGFLKAWFEKQAFKPATTADFRAHLMATLVADNRQAARESEIDEWLYGTGLPATLVEPKSPAFDAIDRDEAVWLAGGSSASAFDTAAWTTQHWLHFINALPDDVTGERMRDLDRTFDLSSSANAEIAFAWYERAIIKHYAPAMPEIEEFLGRVGRGKFIYPLYEALAENGEREFAERVYAKSKTLYHPIAQRRIEEILQKQD